MRKKQGVMNKERSYKKRVNIIKKTIKRLTLKENIQNI